MGEPKPRLEKEVLTKQELQIISQVLFNSRWTGQEWEQVIKSLINKLAKMIDQWNQK